MIRTRRPEGRPDVIVIGGGHNGLVCAAYLARAKLKILLLEAGEHLGGALRPPAPAGEPAALVAHHVARFSPYVQRELGLARHGLKWAVSRLPTRVLPADGPPLLLGPETAPRASETSGLVQADRDRRAALQAELLRDGAMLARAMAAGHFDWAALAPADPGESARRAVMSLADLLDEAFTTPALKAALVADALEGVAATPDTPGTAFVWALQMAETGPAPGLAVPVGGPGQLVAVLEAAARAAGVEIRLSAPVARITLAGDRVGGVVLETGEEIPCGGVVSSLAPAPTFLGLVGVRELDIGATRRLRAAPVPGTVAAVTLTADGAGEAGPGRSARLLIPPAAASAMAPEDPFAGLALDVIVQTAFAPELAGPGQEIVTVLASRLRTPAEGWAAARETLLHAVLRALDPHWPDLGARLTRVEMTTPDQVAAATGAPGGHWHHGEPGLARLLELGRDLEIGGLVLCGAGARPVGGVTGEGGRQAARAVLALKRARQWGTR